jgi:hypothetical protein
MLTRILRKVALWGAVVLAALALLFSIIYQPWQLHWGATPEEILRRMPGDGIVEYPTFNATRAVTINARPEAIWPWIIQIGYGKAGFYSHDWLDNDRIPSANQIIPEYQSLRAGDTVPLSKTEFARVESIQPDSSLVFVYQHESEPTFTWVWVTYPVDHERTRLVVRLRWYQESLRARILTRIFEIVMMRKHMLGIKRRAESRSP